MKKAYLYCYKRDLNEATTYYVDLVSKCLKMKGYSLETVFSIKDIKNPDLIFTITCMCFAKVFFRFPFVKTLSWVQGVLFEEVTMNRFPLWKRYAILLTEWMFVRFSDMLMFVSEKMRDYYQQKFGYNKKNYIIVPCYNCHLRKDVNIRKFETPTFVYAGGLSKWQCIDTMLQTYSIVERKLPKAKLYLYCKRNAYLDELIKKYGIKNFSIDFVTVEELNEKLLQYKYGFILREDSWVNAVSTPTKMNSYLAGYVIPIFSKAVDSFTQHINLGDFTILAETPLNANEIADKIVEFEKVSHDYQQFKGIVTDLFDQYYNDEKYLKQISALIDSHVEKK